tara:strand:+ start:379 stop:570 length:192 start_codon:yes stop_codon:yes gene_type:complete
MSLENKSNDYLSRCEVVDYAIGTWAYFDGENYFNDNGELLKSPCNYDTSTEGYTPFGDEGFDY